jgi:hypothetical protein
MAAMTGGSVEATLEEWAVLPRTEYHAHTGVRVRQPERDGDEEADQHHSRPAQLHSEATA